LNENTNQNNLAFDCQVLMEYICKSANGISKDKDGKICVSKNRLFNFSSSFLKIFSIISY